MKSSSLFFSMRLLSIRSLFIFNLLCVMTVLRVQAQIIRSEPVLSSVQDTITLRYDAAQGNGQLAGQTGPIYLYTGVLTTQSTGPTDWKFVQGQWGQVSDRLRMIPIAGEPNQYQFRFQPRSFYNLPAGEQVIALVMVFHNANFSRVGRQADGSDILYTLPRAALGSYQSHQLAQGVLTVQLAGGHRISIQPYDTDIVRVQWLPTGIQRPDTSLVIAAPAASLSPTLVEQPQTLQLSWAGRRVEVRKDPFRLSFYRQDTLVWAEESGFFQDAQQTGVRMVLPPGMPVYGLGGRAIPQDRRGRRLDLWNQTQYGYTNGLATPNLNVPFLITGRPTGILFDHISRATADVAFSHPQVLEYRVPAGTLLSYYVVMGQHIGQVLEHYTHLTGRQPLPPRWALGYLQSRYGYENEAQARDIVRQMRSADLPMDALILDLYWFGGFGKMGNLSWDNARWPDPARMISDLKAQGIQTVLITQPYINLSATPYRTLADANMLAIDTTLPNRPPGVIPNFWAGSASLLDLHRPATRQWLWERYQALKADGVSGWWSDLGEPESHPLAWTHHFGSAARVHNTYSLVWAGLLYERHRQAYPQERLFNLIRSGWAGIQRYGAIPWSGDVQRSYSGLQAQIPIMLGAGMSGLGYMHGDAGGFTGNVQNDELYLRWLQMAAFSPIMRPHGEGVPTEPVFYNTFTQESIREHVQLRYRLLPYNYTLAWENSSKGWPLARPTHFDEPSNHLLANLNDQYLWGRDFLIAPVMQAGQRQREVRMPASNWIDFWTDSLYPGRQVHSIPVVAGLMPIFVRAGALVPMTPPRPNTKDYQADTLIVHYWPGTRQSAFRMYHDDGQNAQAIAANQFDWLDFGVEARNSREFVFTAQTTGRLPRSTARQLTFMAHRVESRPDEVLVANTFLPLLLSPQAFDAQPQGAYYDAAKRLLMVKTAWQPGQSVQITVRGALITGDPVWRWQDQISLWPNPAQDAWHVQLSPEGPALQSVELTDPAGRSILQMKVESGHTCRIPADALAPGLYLLHIRSQAGHTVRRIVRQ